MPNDLNSQDLNRTGTQSDVAAALGCSQQAVAKWVSKGVVKAGKDGKYHIGQSVAAVEAARDPDSALRGIEGGAAVRGEDLETAASKAGHPGPNQLLRARTVGATLTAQKQQLELAKLKGELISKVEAKQACMAVMSELKTRFDGLPAQAAPLVHACETVAEAEQVLRSMVRQLLTEVSKLGGALDA